MDQPEAVMLNKAAYEDCSKGHTETGGGGGGGEKQGL